jgi:DNA replication initiation complex subunit (GINS family)
MPTIYDETFDAWKKELRSTELQTLRPEYYRDVATHIRRLKEAQRNLDQKSLKAAILDDELERLQVLVRQLLDRRMEKMIRTAGTGHQVPANPWEKWAVEEATNISRHLDRVKEDLAQGMEPPMSPVEKKGTILLRFLQNVPSIIGVDLQTHGPFSKEDIANLPWENAESLIRQGTAAEIRPSRQDTRPVTGQTPAPLE